jgi:hypothetical protein
MPIRSLRLNHSNNSVHEWHQTVSPPGNGLRFPLELLYPGCNPFKMKKWYI